MDYLRALMSISQGYTFSGGWMKSVSSGIFQAREMIQIFSIGFAIILVMGVPLVIGYIKLVRPAYRTGEIWSKIKPVALSTLKMLLIFALANLIFKSIMINLDEYLYYNFKGVIKTSLVFINLVTNCLLFLAQIVFLFNLSRLIIDIPKNGKN